MTVIRLTDAQYATVVQHAKTRLCETYGRGSEPSMAHKRNQAQQLDIWIRSIAGEIAVAQYLDAEWIGDTYNGPAGFDIKPNIEVRTTTPGRNLYIKGRELDPGRYEKPPHTRYFLTWVPNADRQVIKLVGWLPLYEALEHMTPHHANGQLYGYTVAHEHLWPVTCYPNHPAVTHA